MKKVLVLFSLTLIQGCLVSNKEFEELNSESSFHTSAQSIKCMQMILPQQPTPINDKGDTIEVYDQSDCYDDLAKKDIRELNLESKNTEIVVRKSVKNINKMTISEKIVAAEEAKKTPDKKKK